jgi:uncharacterized protein (DUF2235 family)
MRLFLSLLLGLTLVGCATREVGTIRPAPGNPAVAAPGQARVAQDPAKDTCANVWVTIDGTSNTPVSRTAAARLHEMVEAFSYTKPDRPLAIWYAEGVGSADHDLLGKAVGVGVDDDIKKAYAFLTRVWRPCDRLFLNGFSRGAYSVRALGGLLYMAGIPDLSGWNAKKRKAIVEELFAAYKTPRAYPRDPDMALRQANRTAAVAERIKAIYVRHGLDSLDAARAPGFGNSATKVTIDAMTVWDTVQALGLPDRGEDPAEGPAHFLLTACNAKAIFQPLSLDDNRVYSFTPILAGGAQANAICPGGSKRQNVSKVVDEVWFSGAHADVGGNYQAGAMLDGELASVSLNWMLDRLRGIDCEGCGHALALPDDLRVHENRRTAIHDGKRTSIAFAGLFRQSRKPSVYWYHVYGPKKLAIHASVFDRLEWLFALDRITPGCNDEKRPGKSVLCAKEIASHSLIPELQKRGCLATTDWGYRLAEGPQCPVEIGKSSRERPRGVFGCDDDGTEKFFVGMVYDGELEKTRRKVVHRVGHAIPYPRCVTKVVKSEL